MPLPSRLPKKEKRSSRWRSQAHLSFVRKHHCSMPGCQGMPIEAAHVRINSGAGMGEKPHDHRAVSLCQFHHSQQHTIGEPAFWASYKAASGETVEQLIEAFCKASPRALEIRQAKEMADAT